MRRLITLVILAAMAMSQSAGAAAPSAKRR